jgi:hypothetical protein
MVNAPVARSSLLVRRGSAGSEIRENGKREKKRKEKEKGELNGCLQNLFISADDEL